MHTRLVLLLAVLCLVAAACGDGDAGTVTTAGGTATTAAATATGAPIVTPSGDDLSCAALLSLDDVAALFGEPAVFDAGTSEENAGSDSVNCVWSSIEDPADLEDLQVQLFQIQVYRGEQYYAPDLMYDDLERIDGIGDDAFISPQLGVSTGFRDGDRVAFVTFSVIGTGAAADSMTKRDQVIDLLRLVHARVA